MSGATLIAAPKYCKVRIIFDIPLGGAIQNPSVRRQHLRAGRLTADAAIKRCSRWYLTGIALGPRPSEAYEVVIYIVLLVDVGYPGGVGVFHG